MAHRKAGGSTQLGRDSISKRLGVKIFGGQRAKKGNIIVRQRGTKFHAGQNVQRCGDDTLMALADGLVKFTTKKVIAFTGKLSRRRFVHVVPAKQEKEVKKAAAPKAEKKEVPKKAPAKKAPAKKTAKKAAKK